MSYEQQAADFLTATGATVGVVFLGTRPHFEGEEQSRDCYQVTVKTSRGSYSFTYGDSTRNTERRAFALAARVGGVDTASRRVKELGFWVKGNPRATAENILAARKRVPGAYNILACLTKSDPGTLADFCGSYGYDEDSRRGLEIYLAVQEEWNGVRRVFTAEQLELLQEIN